MRALAAGVAAAVLFPATDDRIRVLGRHVANAVAPAGKWIVAGAGGFWTCRCGLVRGHRTLREEHERIVGAGGAA